MTAAAATCEALLDMEGQMSGNRTSLRRGRDPGSLTHSLSLSLPIHVSDTAATSQDGSIFTMQGSEGCVVLIQVLLKCDLHQKNLYRISDRLLISEE